MHMADALLSPAVGGGMYAVSIAAIAYSVKKIKTDELGESKAPLMAVSGAMVFAAQMVNFTIPGTGSSGHIGGGVLLAALLGPFAGTLALAAVLIIQCLCFADGGLLALGCNIFNVAVIPCLIVYPLVMKRILSPAPTAGRINAGSMISAVAALQLGAFCIVVQTTASGVTELPFNAFVLLMQPIHLAIGVVEGVVTAAILNYVNAARPQILTAHTAPPSAPAHGSPALPTGPVPTDAVPASTGPLSTGPVPTDAVPASPGPLPIDAVPASTAALSTGPLPPNPAKPAKPIKTIIIVFAVIAAVTAGGLSLLASAYPDGLEWSVERTAGTDELETSGRVFDTFTAVRERFSFMPGYEAAPGDGSGTPIAGLIGAALVFAAAGAAALLIKAHKKKKRENAVKQNP